MKTIKSLLLPSSGSCEFWKSFINPVNPPLEATLSSVAANKPNLVDSHAEAFSDCGLSLIPLVSFIISSQSYFTHSGAASTPQDLLENESNSLLLAASLFEGLSMDIDALAITVSQSSSTLLQLCDFVESDKTPQTWKSSETLKKNWSMVKSATAKGLIAAASMDDVMMHCLDKNRSAWIIDRCLDWLAREDRPDLCMCSSVILANLARSGSSLGRPITK